MIFKKQKAFSFKQAVRLAALCAALLVAACAGIDKEKAPLVLKPVSYGALPGWGDDNGMAAARQAFEKSCARIVKKDPSVPFGPDGIGGHYADWQAVCAKLQNWPADQTRAFFQQNFTPYLATFDGRGDEGLFTGYYEASLNGSRTKHGPYQYPLRLKPDDLVMVDLGDFRDELKGQRIAGRVKNGRLKPYEDRAQITAGALDDDKLAFVWVDDPVDAFFLQIQGSGRVLLDDGTTMRVGYAGQNGWPYYAIGRELIKRGDLTKETVSLQTIRAWLEENPDQARNIMNLNKSYVFLRQLSGDGPLGGEGVALTAGRSLAVDRTKVPYGAPIWVDIDPPLAGEAPLERLMVAQDTGGAIVGAVRGDVFWGYGPQAEYLAGHMKSQGRYWILLPNSVTPPRDAGGLRLALQ